MTDLQAPVAAADSSTFGFDGKASRQTACLAFALVLCATQLVALEDSYRVAPRWTFPLLGASIAFFSVIMVRRLHEAGRSGLWFLGVLVPGVGVIWAILIMALKARPHAPSPRTHPRLRLAGIVCLCTIFVISCLRVTWAPYFIPSSSMKPSLLVGDFMVVGALGQPAYARGDVVVFRNAADGKDYIKRLIGLPGDTVQMRDGVVFLNGEPLPQTSAGTFTEVFEPQGPAGDLPKCEGGKVAPDAPCNATRLTEVLPNGRRHDVLNLNPASAGDNTRAYLVPKGSFFFMGDNRDNSLDSRYDTDIGGIGLVSSQNLIGRADWIMFSSAGRSLLAFWTWRPERFFKAVE